MPWFRIDDNFAFHPKVLATNNAALGLWVRAGAWSAQQLTDGFVPANVVPTLGGRRKDADSLVACGLWRETDGGWLFHEWHERQPTKASVETERAADRERKKTDRRRGGCRRNHGAECWTANGCSKEARPESVRPDVSRTPVGIRSASSATRPDPTRPVKDDGSLSNHPSVFIARTESDDEEISRLEAIL
jgi:hypothetical protein